MERLMALVDGAEERGGFKQPGAGAGNVPSSAPTSLVSGEASMGWGSGCCVGGSKVLDSGFCVESE